MEIMMSSYSWLKALLFTCLFVTIPLLAIFFWTKSNNADVKTIAESSVETPSESSWQEPEVYGNMVFFVLSGHDRRVAEKRSGLRRRAWQWMEKNRKRPISLSATDGDYGMYGTYTLGFVVEDQ